MGDDGGRLVSFDAEKASRYVNQALWGFMNDPPDSDFQRGFLAALLVVYREGCGKDVSGGRFAILEKGSIYLTSQPSLD